MQIFEMKVGVHIKHIQSVIQSSFTSDKLLRAPWLHQCQSLSRSTTDNWIACCCTRRLLNDRGSPSRQRMPCPHQDEAAKAQGSGRKG